MQYCSSPYVYQRRKTREVVVGDLTEQPTNGVEDTDTWAHDMDTLTASLNDAQEWAELEAVLAEADRQSKASVRREMELVASISTRTGRRLKSIEHDYSGVAQRVELVELRGPVQSFDQAIDSARRGTDPVKLAQQFGLSRGEADLVTRLHGRKKRA